MAMDFPDSPTVGQTFGPYQWDGEKWVTTTGGSSAGGGISQADADARYVNVNGDEMVGDLSFESADTDSPAKIVGKVAGVVRWSMKIGGVDPAKIEGVESMFEIDVHNEDGSVKGPALVIDPYGNIHLPYTLAVLGNMYAHAALRLNLDPIDAMDAVPKKYVDAMVISGGGMPDAPSDGKQYGRQNANWTEIIASAGGGGDYLPLTGGTMTGDIVMANWDSQIVLMPGGNQTNTALHFGEPGTGMWGSTTRISFGVADIEYFRFEGGANIALKPVKLDTQVTPSDPRHLVHKQYVDDAIAAGGGGASGDFLPLTGGTLTGKLSLMGGINNGIALDFGVPGTGFMSAQTNAISIYLGNSPVFQFDGSGLWLPSTEPTDPRHATTKAYVDAITGIDGGSGNYLPIGGGAITGNLSVAGMLEVGDVIIGENFKSFGDAAIAGNIVLGRLAAGLMPRVYGVTDDTDFIRWDITLGNAEAETPLANNGSAFEIAAYDDLGGRAVAMRVDRQSKLATVFGDPTTALGIATKQYVDNNAGGGGGGASVIAADTMPVGAPQNALWWDSTRGKLFINYADADSTQFVEAVKMPPQVEPGIEEAPVDSSDIPYARRRNRWVRVPMKGHIWGLSVFAGNTANPGLEGADPQLQMSEGFSVSGGESVDKWGRFVMPDGGGWKGMGPFEEGRQGAGGLWSSSGDYVVKPDQWYRVYLLGKDNGETDLCYTLEDFWQPPTGFTAYRRIGMVKTKAAGIIGIRAFHAGGQGVNYWFNPPCDHVLANHTVGVPNTNLIISAPDVYGAEAFGTITLECGSTPGAHLLYPSDQLFQGGPPIPLSNGGDQYWTISANTMGRATAQWNLPVYSSTQPRNAGFIRSQHSITSTDVVRIFTRGWVDPRGADKDQD